MIGTPSEWIGSTLTGTGAVSATTGKLIFALPMQAGYQYSVELLVPAMTGPTARIEIKAFEKDRRGTTTRTFSYAKSSDDLASCQAGAGGG